MTIRTNFMNKLLILAILNVCLALFIYFKNFVANFNCKNMQSYNTSQIDRVRFWDRFYCLPQKFKSHAQNSKVSLVNISLMLFIQGNEPTITCWFFLGIFPPFPPGIWDGLPPWFVEFVGLYIRYGIWLCKPFVFHCGTVF